MELINISQKFGKNLIIDNFSCSFPETGAVSLLGPSACGKSTIINIILELIKPSSGSVILNKEADFSVVFQKNQILDKLNCLDHVKKFMKEDSTANPMDYLELVFLDSAASLMPSKLNESMLRRLSIAMALAYDGNIFILDDPFREIESEIKESIIKIFETIKKEKLIIFTSKYEAESKALADIILHLTSNPLKIKMKTITHF